MAAPYPGARHFHARRWGRGAGPGVESPEEECCEVVVTAGDADAPAGLTRLLVEETRAP
jgi:hypothetical protein